MTLDIREDAILGRRAVDDGMHLLVVAGNARRVHARAKEARRRRYLKRLRVFPETIEPGVLERAEMVSDLIVAPESLMRGFFRTPTGSGWALVGDACHFKHPGTAQGIGDAVEQGIRRAELLSGANPRLESS